MFGSRFTTRQWSPASSVRHSSPSVFVSLITAKPARIHDIRILWIDDQPCDLVALREADVRPVLAAVDRLVHPVADRRVVARIFLARSDVDDVRVARRDGDGADGADALL